MHILMGAKKRQDKPKNVQYYQIMFKFLLDDCFIVRFPCSGR